MLEATHDYYWTGFSTLQIPIGKEHMATSEDTLERYYQLLDRVPYCPDVGVKHLALGWFIILYTVPIHSLMYLFFKIF